jgi:hypothetical protein
LKFKIFELSLNEMVSRKTKFKYFLNIKYGTPVGIHEEEVIVLSSSYKDLEKYLLLI